jgi:hypothetical protein
MDAKRRKKAAKSILNLYPASIGIVMRPVCMPIDNRANKIATNFAIVFKLFFITLLVLKLFLLILYAKAE